MPKNPHISGRPIMPPSKPSSVEYMDVESAMEEKRAVRVLDVLGFDTDVPQTHVDQMEIFLRAFDIFADREVRYKDAWKKRGFKGALLQVDRKTERMMQMYWHQDLRELEIIDLDDAYDLLNYAVFFIRLVMEGNETGR